MAEEIKITHHYDRDADVLYIDFGSNEPCFTEDVDGLFMVDIGWFSHLPRGVRILSPKTRKIRSINMMIGKIDKTCRKLMENQAETIKKTEPVLQTDLSKKLSQAFTCVS